MLILLRLEGGEEVLKQILAGDVFVVVGLVEDGKRGFVDLLVLGATGRRLLSSHALIIIGSRKDIFR